MNYLGHLFLSGDDPQVILGNFMADGVKGRDLSRFEEGVQRGIRLHRAIDSFMDQHPAVRSGRERVRGHAGRYAGVVMDLFFDHLLASRWEHYHAEPLDQFAQRMYVLLDGHRSQMPHEVGSLFGFMRERDLLTSYSTLPGIGRSLLGLSRRVPAGEVMAGAEVVLQEHLVEYTREFAAFIPDITVHTAEWR